MRSRLPAVVALVVLLALAGCAETPSTPTVEPPRQPGPVLDSAVLKNGTEVRLVSVSATPPASWTDDLTGVPLAGAVLFLGFEVVNSSEASLTMPPRPSTPEVVAADGTQLRHQGIGGIIGSRGTRWRQLDPGETMPVLFSFTTTSAAEAAPRAFGGPKPPARPLTVKYAPFWSEAVTFTVP